VRGSRRSRGVWVFVFLLLTLAVVYGAFGYLYVVFERRLDEELGARLMAVATASAAAVNGPVWTGIRTGDPAVVGTARRELREILDANDLADIFLFDAAETTVLDLRGAYPEGEPNPALGFDVVAATEALAGLPSYTRLYESQGVVLKSGYAPVFDDTSAVIGGVGVEASAAFFSVLETVRGALLGAAGVVSLGMVLLGAGFVRIQQREGRLEARLRRAETLASMGQMTAMLAHEIRNPLGIIRGAAETLAERYDLADDEVYRFIPEEVDRLHQTLGAYLEFSRVDRPREVVDLGEAVRRTAGLAGPELERYGIAVTVDVAEEALPVRGSAPMVQQALLNLVLNARDAMPEGGALTLGAARRGGRIEVVVRDTGVGMTEAVAARALTPFFTDKEKGSGLGLAVVGRVVEECGGRIAIDSGPGRGTTVTLAFPRAAEGEAG
jgi:signal transduction histidine kinase